MSFRSQKFSTIVNNSPSSQSQNNIFNTFDSYINNTKQLYYDIDTNNYYLTISTNPNPIKANIFGKKLAHMKNNRTGFYSYENRLSDFSIDKITFDVDNSLYRPQTKFFEGYSQFPRPLSNPFINEEINQETKNSMMNKLENKKGIITQDKNEIMFNKKINEGLHFYTGSVNNLPNFEEKNYLLKKIEKNIIEEKNNLINDTKNKKNEIEHKIHALNQLKKKLISNSKNKINGRELQKPPKEFYEKFQIFHNILFVNPINKSKEKVKYVVRDSKYYVSDFYKTLNQVNDKKKKRIKIKKSLNININDNEDDNKYLYNNKFSNCPKIKLNDNTLFTLPPKIKQKTILKKNNTEAEILAREPNSIIDKKNIKIIKTGNDYRLYNDIKKNYNDEKKLLHGFIKPVKKNERLYRRYLPKYKSAVDIIKKEFETFKLVNPIRVKLDDEKEKKEIKLIQKKIQQSRCLLEYIKNTKNIGNGSKLLSNSNTSKSHCSKNSKVF